MMALMMVTVLFCSCKDTPKTSGNTEPKETPIALGYSLNQFGLKLDNASVMQR